MEPSESLPSRNLSRAPSRHLHLYLGHLSTNSQDAFEKRTALRKIYRTQKLATNYQFVFRFVLSFSAAGTNSTDSTLPDKHLPDMLLASGPSDYHNLIYKVRALFMDAARNYPHAKFVAKMDDDSVCIVPHLISALLADAKKSNLPMYWGCVWEHAQIIVDNSRHRYYTGSYANHTLLRGGDRVLPFMIGAGYVVDRRIVHYLRAIEDDVGLFVGSGVEDQNFRLWLLPIDVYKSSHCDRFMQIGDLRPEREIGWRLCDGRSLVAHHIPTRYISGGRLPEYLGNCLRRHGGSHYFLSSSRGL